MHFDTNGISTALYMVIAYMQMQYMQSHVNIHETCLEMKSSSAYRDGRLTR